MVIKSYITTLIGIAILSILIEVILPSSKMQKFVKAMFNIVILTAIILPVFTFIKKDFKIESLFKFEQIEMDSDFLEASNKKIYSQLEKTIETECSNIGYSNIDIKIDFEQINDKTQVSKITINISDVKVNINIPHNEIKTDILQVVNKYINIENLNIIFLK